MICGRYEGVDERVAEHLADDELSIGDYVLSGGELAAAVVVDSVAQAPAGRAGEPGFGRVRILWTRMDSWIARSTRDRPSFRGWKAPDVLLGGNHEEIRHWRRQASREKTAEPPGSTTIEY